MADRTSVRTTKRVTLVLAIINQFLVTSMISTINIALPTIGKELAVEAVMLGWISNALMLATAVVLLPAGRLADIYGRKKIFLCGMAITAVSSFLCAVTTSGIWLVILRAFQGVGGGLAVGTQLAIVTSVFPPEERGRALGAVLGAVYCGIAVGPFIGGVLTQQLGWQSIFYIWSFVCLVVFVLTIWLLKGEWAEARGEKFDVVGAVILSASLLVIMYGFTVLPRVTGFVLVILGVIGLLAFARWEGRVKSPILNIALFKRNAVFVFSNLANLLNYSAVFPVTFLLSLYLQYISGYSPQTAGLILLVQPVIMAVFAPITGRLSDRVTPRVLASLGLALNCVSLFLMTFLAEGSVLGYLIGCTVVLGFGMAVFASPNSNAIMGSVEKRFLGVASGAMSNMRTFGMTIGMAVVMILFSIYIGPTEITPAYYPAFLESMRTAFIIFTAISFGSIFVQFIARRAGKPAVSQG